MADTGAKTGKLRILSNSGEPFETRVEAAGLLAAQLEEYRGGKTAVLGIPRGGIIIADEISRRLDADMDIILTHKLGAPYNSELAVGAVCEDGTHFVNQSIAGYVGANSNYINREKAAQLREITHRVNLYRPVLAKLKVENRVVITVDDGVATGATMQAALWAIRKENPVKLILAIPVGPPDTVQTLAQDADETVCLRAPYDFMALGRFYKEFPQVEDDLLIKILGEQNKRRRSQ
jgi:putative phosphoribosyl transferase